MTNNEYGIICDRIIAETMKYIDTTNIKRYMIDKNTIQSNGGAVYTSALISSAPISLIYTPAGTGKSSLIRDRVHALESIGVPSNKIMVLNMNIAKSKQMALELPGVNVMTFSDFTHGIFANNIPDCNLSDIASIANSLRLCSQDKFVKELIDLLTTTNQKDRATLLTLFVNAHIAEVLNVLKSIKKIDYSLESMVCQNQMYYFDKNPYDIESIIINGVHNMPIPNLCTVLEYVNKYHCNLFITGSPDETIYDFNMAYAHSMNMLSSYSNKQINIVRLNEMKNMTDDIKFVLNKTPVVKVNSANVSVAHLTVNFDIPVKKMVQSTLGKGAPYIDQKLANHESMLILARSKSDISDIKQVLEETYLPIYPDLWIADLTTIQATETSYGDVASIYYASLLSKYPNGITTGQFFYEIYNALNQEIVKLDSPYKKSQYEYDILHLNEFVQNNMTTFIDMNAMFQVKDIITKLIDLESSKIQDHVDQIKNEAIIDISKADIILSTIHSATDIRHDNVVLFMRNNTDKIDNAVYRVALSRANKSEYLIFANYGNFDTEYQRYLKTHIQ